MGRIYPQRPGNRLVPPVRDLVILAGGESRRMGVDKARLTIAGETLLIRLARLGVQVLGRSWVVGRIPEPHWQGPEVGWLLDDQRGLGPLGGLSTALARLQRPCLLVGCDMPAVSAQGLDYLARRWRRDGGRHGCITRAPGGLEPLFAVYAPAIIPIIQAAIARSWLSLHRLVTASDLAPRPLPRALWREVANMNHPEDAEGMVDQVPAPL